MIRATAGGCTLAIRVQPGAKKTAITGVYGTGDETALKIAIQSPPIEGRANEALIAFLAQTLHLPKSSIHLLSGQSSRSKIIQIKGVTAAEAERLLHPDHFTGTE
jgi:uncharacterized protein